MGVVERFGKFHSVRDDGIHVIIPFVDSMIKVNTTEQSTNVKPSDMITEDNLNAEVDLVVYYRVRPNSDDVKKSIYEVDFFERQIVSLAKTTARSVIGTMRFEEVNNNRQELNNRLEEELEEQTDGWGVQIVRVELEEITPPSDVQDSMNEIIKAENKKDAAEDFATAEETKADGERRAEIKRAEGKKEAQILEAEGEAESIQKVAEARAEEIEIVNESIQSHFQDEAQTYKKLETVVDSLQHGSKYILDADRDVTTVLSEVGGVTPLDSASDDDEAGDEYDIKEQMTEAVEEQREATNA